MKQLLDAWPDRFMIGTDIAHTVLRKAFPVRVSMTRVLLGQLAPDAAQKIGVDNARRLFAPVLRQQ
jgi:predicted TIM-barrel fold metal-dependent hydrolase